MIPILPVRDPHPKPNAKAALLLLNRFQEQSIAKLQKYPPKPAKSRYRRTLDLKGGWEGETITGNSFEINIFNDIRYSGYVQGRRFAKGDVNQLKRFQKGGWVSLTDIDKDWNSGPRLRVAIALKLDLKRLPVIRI